MFDDFFIHMEKGIIEFDPKPTFFFDFFPIGSLSPIIPVKHKGGILRSDSELQDFLSRIFLGAIFSSLDLFGFLIIFTGRGVGFASGRRFGGCKGSGRGCGVFRLAKIRWFAGRLGSRPRTEAGEFLCRRIFVLYCSIGASEISSRESLGFAVTPKR